MDIFTKNKLTALTIVLLVLFNVTTLVIIWSERMLPPVPQDAEPPLQRRGRTLVFLKKELGLTGEQVREYRKLRLQHGAQMRKGNKEIRLLKRELLDQLFYDKIDSLKVERIIDSIGEKQQKIERLTFNHFNDLKNLCGENQQEKLHKLLGELFRPPEMMRDRPMPQRREDRPPKNRF